MPRDNTYGPIVKERVKTFVRELLRDEVEQKYASDITIRWEDQNNSKPTLVVKGKTRFFYNNFNLSQDNFREIMNQLEELGILEDRRITKRGNDDRHFVLKLWSRDIDKNLREFDLAWETQKPKGQREIPSNSPPVPQNIDPVRSKYDIEREPKESQCLETILQPGSFLRIKGPQNMGKTRLLNRVLVKVKEDKEDDCQIVILNWQNEFDSTTFNNYNEFLKNFCATSEKYLGLRNNLDTYWNDYGSANNKTTGYFSQSLLPQIDSQLILVLEEMDLVFDYPLIATEFCGLLRGWHEESKRDKLWQKLSLVIVHSTDKYASLDITNSPLNNIGETIPIEEFTRSEVDQIIQSYDLSLSNEQVENLIALVKGHPFLVNHALKKMAFQSMKLEDILAKADTKESIYRDHLLKLLNILQENPPLKEAFKKVVTESAPVNLNAHISFKLESVGLIRINGDLAEPRNPLYRQYFAKNL